MVILNLQKFATTLLLRWLWLEWDYPPRAWYGIAVPCNMKDRGFFRTATKVALGDDSKAKFWESSWLDAIDPKDIVLEIFELSRNKCGTVASALRDDHWITLIDTRAGLSLVRFEQFVALWNKLLHITIQPGVQDTIHWKLSSDGAYTAKTSYLAKFVGLVRSNLQTIVWRLGPLPSVFFAWLVTQNRIWTTDILQCRGWPNCNCCPLCSQVQESTTHLLFK